MIFSVLTLPNEPWASLVGRWRQLDEQGWDAIYVADQLANPFVAGQPWLDAATCLGALAVVTEQARIGTLVTPPTFRNAASVARMALTVEAASGGRLALALGAGGSPNDERLAGVVAEQADERARRFAAFVRNVRRLLDDTSWLPRPDRRLPITLGGQSDGIIALVAELGDGWNTYGGRGLSAAEGRERANERAVLLDELCARHGRAPGSVRRSVLLGYRFVQEEPFRSEEDFARVAQAWHALGFDELVIYADLAYMFERGVTPPSGILESVARNVLPGLRRTLR